MKSLLEETVELDNVIRQMRKMESKMRSGQWIDAWRDCNKVISLLEKSKEDIIRNSENAK